MRHCDLVRLEKWSAQWGRTTEGSGVRELFISRLAPSFF